MQVPLLDLKLQYAPLRAEIEAAIRGVCDEQRFVLGPKLCTLGFEESHAIIPRHRGSFMERQECGA